MSENEKKINEKKRILLFFLKKHNIFPYFVKNAELSSSREFLSIKSIFVMVALSNLFGSFFPFFASKYPIIEDKLSFWLHYYELWHQWIKSEQYKEDIRTYARNNNRNKTA